MERVTPIDSTVTAVITIQKKQRSRRRPGITSTSSNCKVDSIMTYVDSVSVIIATCPQVK